MNHNSDELITSKELHDLFAARRPEPKSFLAGVEAGIAELEALDAEDSSVRPEIFLKRVAGLLPIHPGGIALAGSAPTKWLYMTLALPALVLVSVIGVFFSSWRVVSHEAQNSEPGTD